MVGSVRFELTKSGSKVQRNSRLYDEPIKVVSHESVKLSSPVRETGILVGRRMGLKLVGPDGNDPSSTN